MDRHDQEAMAPDRGSWSHGHRSIAGRPGGPADNPTEDPIRRILPAINPWPTRDPTHHIDPYPRSNGPPTPMVIDP